MCGCPGLGPGACDAFLQANDPWYFATDAEQASRDAIANDLCDDSYDYDWPLPSTPKEMRETIAHGHQEMDLIKFQTCRRMSGMNADTLWWLAGKGHWNYMAERCK